MRRFYCGCGAQLYFDNTACLSCGHDVGFNPATLSFRALSPPTRPGETRSDVHHPGPNRYAVCHNGAIYGTCNWLTETDGKLCRSCKLNETIPNLADRRRRALFGVAEQAKRRFLYTALALDLPVEGKHQHANGLAFHIRGDDRLDGDRSTAASKNPVQTGHANGFITVNLMEADPSMRTEMREAMGERYRTVLGHFRHESGHYYFDRLVANTPLLPAARALFGDDAVDYRKAMAAHYDNGPPNDWETQYLTRYASAHPFEDFAETWAHYFHIIETLETAAAEALVVDTLAITDPISHPTPDLTPILNQWWAVREVLNRLNRSMGLDEPYPFEHPPPVQKKLAFVHHVVNSRRPPG